MTTLKPKTEVKPSVHSLKDKKAAKDKLITLSILLEISVDSYTTEILYTKVKRKEVEM